ncbi:neurotrimin-like isoform X2 [Sitophilus oryzae]|nr:neurotrimin-like isoform X2 [Sitophilus oryzae]
MCQINTDPMKSQVGYLNVVVPPDILDYPTSADMVAREGSSISLRCAATGSPEPSVTWRREGGELIPIGNGLEAASFDGPVLNISKVNRLQMGPYLCIASNGVPPSVSKRIMLIVHFAPMIWIQNQLVGAMEGQQITLECHSEAYPKSINYWTKDDGHIISQGTKYEPTIADNAYKVHMKLVIRKVSQSDYGSYKCVAKNSLGETDGTIKLYHIPSPSTVRPTTLSTAPTVHLVTLKDAVRQQKHAIDKTSKNADENRKHAENENSNILDYKKTDVEELNQDQSSQLASNCPPVCIDIFITIVVCRMFLMLCNIIC